MKPSFSLVQICGMNDEQKEIMRLLSPDIKGPVQTAFTPDQLDRIKFNAQVAAEVVPKLNELPGSLAGYIAARQEDTRMIRDTLSMMRNHKRRILGGLGALKEKSRKLIKYNIGVNGDGS